MSAPPSALAAGATAAPPPGTALAPLRPPGPADAAALAPAEKASIVLAALGPEQAAPILQALGEPAIRRFARTIAGMGVIPGPVIEAVVAEFLAALGSGRDLAGGLSTARKLLAGALDGDALDRILEEVRGTRSLSVWDRLGTAPVGSVASFVAGEHPQFGAVLLSRLRADRAARILERLPAGVARGIVLRMRRAPRLDPAVLEMVTAVIEEEFLSVIRREQASRKPAELLAGLMNHVSGAAREGFLGELEQAEPAFAAEVQRVMFTFGDILARVNPRDVAQIVRAVEEPELMAALKSGQETHPRVVEFLLANLARRLAERITEDLAAMPPVPLKEGEAAQAALVQAIQALARQGEIRLNQPEAPDAD
jgi:flagellar motor switch protein FliG